MPILSSHWRVSSKKGSPATATCRCLLSRDLIIKLHMSSRRTDYMRKWFYCTANWGNVWASSSDMRYRHGFVLSYVCVFMHAWMPHLCSLKYGSALMCALYFVAKIWVIGNHPAVVQSFRWSIVWDNYIGCVIVSSIAHIAIIVHDSLCIVKLRTSFGITAKAILPYMVCLDCVVRTDHVSCFE